MSRGLLVALEGSPAAPTALQAQRLSMQLDAGGVPCHVVDPGRSWLRPDTLRAVDLRPFPGRVAPLLARLTLLADLAERQIRPLLSAGVVVIVDRYRETFLAHAVARGWDPEWIDALLAPLPRPDLALYLRLGRERRLPVMLESGAVLDGWESGLDAVRAGSLGRALRSYQTRLDRGFVEACRRRGDVEVLDGESDADALSRGIHRHVLAVLEGSA